MIVAVFTVGMVEMPLHHIVDVIAVGYCLVAAIRSVFVLGIVTIALVAVGAVGRVCSIDLKLMLVNMTFMHRVQMAIVEVVSVAVVSDRCVAAILAMLMRMVLVNLVI